MTERELFDQYNKDVYRTCYYMLRNASDAEDLCQDVFIKALAANWEQVEHIKTWLMRITARECLNHLKRNRTRQMKETMLQWFTPRIEEASVQQHLERLEETNEWKLRMNQLPEKQRLVVALRFTNELSYSEIAEVLNIPEGTVKSRLSKGLRKMKQVWEQDHLNEEGSVDYEAQREQRELREHRVQEAKG